MSCISLRIGPLKHVKVPKGSWGSLLSLNSFKTRLSPKVVGRSTILEAQASFSAVEHSRRVEEAPTPTFQVKAALADEPKPPEAVQAEDYGVKPRS